MTPEEEAHWRYQLELMTGWDYHGRRIANQFNKIPDEVLWLCEEARYKGHLATVWLRREAAANGGQIF